MKVDQTGDNALTFGSAAIPPINRITGGSPPAPVEPPTERTSSWLNTQKRRRMTKFSVLDRVRQFLPQLAESNASLPSRDQHELDIENVGDDGPYYIEMVWIPITMSPLAYPLQNLGLGVFEYGRRETHPDEESSASSSSSSSPTSELDSEDGDSSSSGSSSCSEDGAQAATRPKKPLPRRATPRITVLNESENPPGGSSG